MTLLLSALIVGGLHALAPDHWMPFAALSRARNWTARKTALVTLAAGMLHVASSLALGVVGISFGRSFAEINHWEGLRGGWFSFLLIGFGLTHMLWCLKQSNKRKMEQSRSGRDETFYWAYFALFVLGPCEPLIPFLFLSEGKGSNLAVPVVLLFCAATCTVMTAAALAVSKGLESARLPKPFESNPAAGAGAAIALTGLLVKILGL